MPADPTKPASSPPERPKASLGQVFGAVFWSFFGVRKGRAMEHDAVTIKPLHVIVVGVIAAAVLVLVLMLLVLLITH